MAFMTVSGGIIDFTAGYHQHLLGGRQPSSCKLWLSEVQDFVSSLEFGGAA